MRTLALIDASNYLYRAFYAIRGLSGPGGRPTNATYGFANMLNKYRTDRRPDALVAVFDHPERTFRHTLDKEYKAQRQAMPDELGPQIADTKRLCQLLGVAVMEERGFEADDLIAALAVRAAAGGARVEIASMDKDLLQLVEDDRVVVWHPLKEELLDRDGVTRSFGVPPERVVDVLAIMGDSVDNIPGVAGIGEKGALDLVSAYGSLDDVYANLDKLPPKKREKLEKSREDAFRSRELATVRRDAPLPGLAEGEDALARFELRPLDAGQLRELLSFYDELGFGKLKRDLLESGAAITPAAPSEVPPAEPARWLETPELLAELVAAARAAGRIGLHLELAGGFPPDPLAACVALPDGATAAFSLTGEPGFGALRELLGDPGLQVVCHDSKRLYWVALARGLPLLAALDDVMLSSYVVAPGLHTHDLPGDARVFLNRPPETLPSTKGPAAGELFQNDEVLQHLGPRALLPLQLQEVLEPRLQATPSLRQVLAEIERPLVPVLARMELAGIAVDRAVLAELSADFTRRLSDLEREIHSVAGEPFNIGSPQQLGRILFEKLAYPVVRKTSKTKSYATDSEVLEELAGASPGPMPGLVLKWRELSKLKGTYVDALPLHIAADGRIHTRFDQAVAATGRLSSNDPNLQNIPIRSEEGRVIRRAFVAPPGRVLLTADYSQIELRILAHLSGDQALVEVFRRGEDIHRATASKMFGTDPGLLTPDQRRAAKTINFGVLYGMGPFALSSQLGVSQSEAKAFIKAYFERFPSIRGCLDAILQQARQTGFTETIFGRLRPIPGLGDRNHAVRSNAERMAMNAPFQGSAADLIKKAMISLDAELRGQVASARLLLQVHDELVIECAEEDGERTSAIAKEVMEGAASLKVPLTVDVGRGANWAEAK